MKLSSAKALVLVGLAVFTLHMPCVRAADGGAGKEPTRPSQAGDNVAVGRKYTLDPLPNYPLCADPSDVTKLTDGVYTEGYFWTQKKTTVGWQNASPVTITIDLGAIFPIQGISYNTASGVAGVQWPTCILLLVSNDDRSYYYAGDLVDLDKEHGPPKPDAYAVHRYWTNRLNTFGRYVELLITSDGPFIFVDEIEVRRGPDAPLVRPPEAKEIGDVKAFFRECTVARGFRRRLENDLAAVREALKGVPARQDFEASCAAIESDIGHLPIASPADLRTEFPVNKLHERIFAVQAAIWRAKGLKPITLWQRNKWDMVSPTELPGPDEAKIVVQMMRNEFRSAAFNISNAGEAVARVTLSIEGLPGGANPESITVHDAPFTDTKSGVPIMAALPLANRDAGGYLFEIHPGLTRQVWLTFNSRDVAPGEYDGRIIIQPGGLQVPVAWKVCPLTFPDLPTLHLGGWDYTNLDRIYGVTPENRAALIRHLREHFVDTPWATNAVLPTGEYDMDGQMVKEPDAGNFEAWVRLWPNARNYYVFANVQSSFCGFKPGTPAFQKAVASWITWWANKLKVRNIRPNQLGLLLVDEPSEMPPSEVIIAYARVIRAAQPQVVVWEDVTWPEPWKAPPELFTLCTVLCPNLPECIEKGRPYAGFYLQQRDEGRQLWFYSCNGPGKLLDPYSYHRMEPWFCWKYGAKGSCFWAFGDTNGASSWNQYLATGPGDYTPLFLDNATVTPGKHMEAIREGVEDYEYLRMLRDRVVELEKAGKKEEALDSARKLLASAAERVTSSVTKVSALEWAAPKDRSVADAVRVEVLEALMNLH